MKIINSIDGAFDHVGAELGVSAWLTVDQDRIDDFATTTLDRQWIHVDVDKAKEGPYGATIAHGFLTLSLIPAMSKENYLVENTKMAINYGMNKVRFLTPVKVGSRIRLRSELVDVAKVNDSTVNLTVRHTMEIEGIDKPAAVADLVARYVF